MLFIYDGKKGRGKMGKEAKVRGREGGSWRERVRERDPGFSPHFYFREQGRKEPCEALKLESNGESLQ